MHRGKTILRVIKTKFHSKKLLPQDPTAGFQPDRQTDTKSEKYRKYAIHKKGRIFKAKTAGQIIGLSINKFDYDITTKNNFI